MTSLPPTPHPLDPIADKPPAHAELWRHAPAWVLAYVALWSAPGYAEAVLVLASLSAIVSLLLARRHGGTLPLTTRALALSSALFAAYWLPELISSIGAVNPGRALREALADVRYLPFLWLVAAAVSSTRGRRVTFSGLAVIVLIWSLDALLEALFGTSPLFWGVDQLKQIISARPMCPPQAQPIGLVSGMFGPCNLKLGQILASLSPFLLYAARRRFGAGGLALAAALIGVVIVLAGSRASWLTFALVLLLSGWHLVGWKKTAAALLAGTVVLAVLGVGVPEVSRRLEQTTQALSANGNGVESALSGRLKVWSAALCMAGGNPVNGVGVRNFREAFAACDPDPDQAPVWGSGPALHAHQIVLEIASETGLVGLLLWLAAAALVWRSWHVALPAARDAAHPALLALGVTVFPFNTHLAFYSNFWGGLTLLLAALYAGALLGSSRGEGAVEAHQ